MNSTYNDSWLLKSTCSLKERVYSPVYLYFKLLNATYLRLLVGPGVFLNVLCLWMLFWKKLSNKSTTIIFLQLLAIFDILSIVLKYIRAEVNYQSMEKGHQISFLIPSVCKSLYVAMNSCISIAMWIIVLMSLDKAIAVSYPLKASILLTRKRVFYLCFITIIILFCVNLWFIKLSGIQISRNKRKYCGLTNESFLVDLLTASILPMALITATNIFITTVLHRASNAWKLSEPRCAKDPDSSSCRNSSTPLVHGNSSIHAAASAADVLLANKRRVNAQVTRMLLAVTLSLIICNIPNTLFFVFVKIYDVRNVLFGRVCSEISDYDIKLYKLGFYSSTIQDILSDLPHIFNFFLYCLAGKKFRSMFIHEVRQTFVCLRLSKPNIRTPTCKSYISFNGKESLSHSSKLKRIPTNGHIPKVRASVEVLMNTNTTNTLKNEKPLICTKDNDHLRNKKSVNHAHSTKL